MLNLKDIRKRIVTVKNTQKITRVMTMISAAKLHKARQNINQSRPYHIELQDVFFSLSKIAPESLESFTRKPSEEKTKVAVLLLTSDRGLCGAFNSGLCKQLSIFLEKKQNADLFVIGKKGKGFFDQQKEISIVDAHCKKKEKDLKIEISKLSQLLVKRFLQEEYDEVYLAFNYFTSSVTQSPKIQQFLPLDFEKQDKEEKTEEITQAIFEPSMKQFSNELLPVYLENLCYLCLLNSFAGEHASRMRVMDAATNNARDLITKLQMQYNRARQANITTELTEIISGAESV